MNPFIQNMVIEKETLDDRLRKLQHYISNNLIFQELPLVERELMRRHYATMDAYAEVLGERIELARSRSDYPQISTPKDKVDEWNRLHPVGTGVTYFRLRKPYEKPVMTKTTSKAWLLADAEPVVMLDGQQYAVALHHVVPWVAAPLPLEKEKAPTGEQPTHRVVEVLYTHPGHSSYHDNGMWIKTPAPEGGCWLRPGQAVAIVDVVSPVVEEVKEKMLGDIRQGAERALRERDDCEREPND